MRQKITQATLVVVTLAVDEPLLSFNYLSIVAIIYGLL